MNRLLARGATLACAAALIAGCGGAAAPSGAAKPAAAAKPASSGAPAQPASAPANAKLTPVTFRLDYIVEGEHAAYFAALKEGYYKAAGLDVKIEVGQGSITTIDTVANGSTDIGLADATATVKAITKGVPVKVVADVFQKSPMAVAYDKKHNPIATPQAICGKTIGESVGSASSQLFPAFLSINKISPSCFKIVQTTGSALPALLLKHKIDGYLTFPMESLPPLEAKGLDAGALQWADYGFDVLGTGIITSDTYLKQHPGVVAKFIAATAKGWAFAAQHPNQAAKILHAYHPQSAPPGTAGSLKLAVPLLHTANSAGHPFGWMAPADWAATLKTLQQYGGLKNPKPPTAYYTDALIK